MDNWKYFAQGFEKVAVDFKIIFTILNISSLSDCTFQFLH